MRLKTVHGWFDSKGELNRYLFLMDCEKKQIIRNLRRQVQYDLEVNGEHICVYIADYVYERHVAGDHWQEVVEDFKGVLTEVFKLKAKLFRAVYGYSIRVVKTTTEAP